jgi:hypothetical protein
LNISEKNYFFAKKTNKKKMVAGFRDYIGKFDKLTFKAPIPNKKGYPTVNFSLDDTVMKFQVTKFNEPHTKAPFGISVYIEKGATQDQIEAKEREARKNFDIAIKSKEFISFIQHFEEAIIQAAIKNKATWFKKGETLSDEQIRSMFTSSLVIDDKYDPRLRTKVNCEGKCPVKIVQYQVVNDQAFHKLLTPNDIMKKPIECIDILECSSLWFQAKSFGASFVSSDILVFEEVGGNEFPFDMGAAAMPMKFGGQNQVVETPKEEPENASVLFSSSSIVSCEDGVILTQPISEIVLAENPPPKKQRV